MMSNNSTDIFDRQQRIARADNFALDSFLGYFLFAGLLRDFLFAGFLGYFLFAGLLCDFLLDFFRCPLF